MKLKTINSNFKVPKKDREDFNKKGGVLIKGLSSKALIDYFKFKVNKELQRPSDRYQTGFNQTKYDVFDKDENEYDFLGDRLFQTDYKKRLLE